MSTIDSLRPGMRAVAKEAAEKGVISQRDLAMLLTRPVNRATQDWASGLVRENRVVLQRPTGAVAPGTATKTTGDHDKWAVASRLEYAIASVSSAEMQEHMSEWKRAQGFR